MANPLAERYAEALLEKIAGDKYPSTTDMDMLEAIAPEGPGSVSSCT